MEIHLLFYLVLSFIGGGSTFLQQEAASFCRTDKIGSVQITYNLTENGFCVDMNNLKRNTNYAVGILDCTSGFSTCQQFFDTSSSSVADSGCLLFNYSCLTCGNEEAISNFDPFQGNTVSLRINKPGCVFTEKTSTSTLPSTSTDSISTSISSTSTDLVSTTIPSTHEGLTSTVVLLTHKDLAPSTRTASNKVIISVSVLSAFLIASIVVASFVWYVRTKKRQRFHLSSNIERSGPSNVQGLVICCPCSKVHREATKEFLSLINNFTDFHATSYLDLRLSQDTDIPTLVKHLCGKVNWMIIIESANFYHHSKEEDLNEFSFCSLMARFSVQLLKHCIKIKSLNLKTIYRISFDLKSEESELRRLFPELNGHIYGLLQQTMNIGYCLNFDEIESFFSNLTQEQLGSSDKNMRRWTNNIWKESSEAKNLEKALVNRTDEQWNSSGCYLVDNTCSAASILVDNSQPKTMLSFWENLNGNNHTDRLEIDKYYERPEKESDSIGTFGTRFSFEKSEQLTDNQSLMNQFPYSGNIPSGSSDISSDIISLELQRINFETDATIRNNLSKVIEEPFDDLEQLSV